MKTAAWVTIATSAAPMVVGGVAEGISNRVGSGKTETQETSRLEAENSNFEHVEGLETKTKPAPTVSGNVGAQKQGPDQTLVSKRIEELKSGSFDGKAISSDQKVSADGTTQEDVTREALSQMKAKRASDDDYTTYKDKVAARKSKNELRLNTLAQNRSQRSQFTNQLGSVAGQVSQGASSYIQGAGTAEKGKHDADKDLMSGSAQQSSAAISNFAQQQSKAYDNAIGIIQVEKAILQSSNPNGGG